MKVVQLLQVHYNLLFNEKGRKKLGFLLAPILAKSEHQQKLFYTSYDNYLKSLKVEEEKSSDKGLPNKDKNILSNLLLAFLGALFLIIIGIGWFLSEKNKKSIDRYHFEIKEEGKDQILTPPFEIPVGTKLIFNNTTDSLLRIGKRFHWKWLDQQTREVLDSLPDSHDWKLESKPTRNPNIRILVMQTILEETGEELDRDTALFTIRCSHIRPDLDIQTDVEDSDLKINTPISFRPSLIDTSLYSYEWDFGDGIKSRDAIFEHRFTREEKYVVNLEITPNNSDAPNCSFFETKIIDLTPGFPKIEEFTLQKEVLSNEWKWSNVTSILLILFFTYCIYLWWLYFNRTGKEQKEVDQWMRVYREKLKLIDGKPYQIPYQDQNGEILIAQEQFTISKALRQRTEGERKEINIPISIKNTINKGGFPNLQYTTSTKPSDYIFLIDLQSADSHQAKLFQYLVGLWEKEDVHFQLYYYDKDLTRIWDAKSKQPNSLNNLFRDFSERRLIIFGSAHSLLNSRKGEIFNSAYKEEILNWKNKLLITPIPVFDWSYKEARLYKLFPIFPAELGGLIKAAQYIEKGMIEEDLPLTLSQWEKEFVELEVELETDRYWDNVYEHRDYLRHHPEVFRWLIALVVHPKPTWNITIAIGKALGISITYEKLLLLSRIPWLQRGEMNYHFWQEVWQEKELSIEDEKKARLAIKNELEKEAVQKEILSSYAQRDLERNLLVHDFALDPQNRKYQTGINFLVQQEYVNPVLQDELDWIVRRHTTNYEEGNRVGRTISLYLKKQAVKRPILTSGLWKALLMCLLYIYIHGNLIEIGPENIAQFINTSNTEQLKDNIFSRYVQNAPHDAARLNNRGIDIYYGQIPITSKGISKDSSELYFYAFNSLSSDIFRATAENFLEALKIDPQYELARINLAKLIHNHGVDRYEEFSKNRETAEAFGVHFENAKSIWDDLNTNYDSLRFHSYHGLGLSYFYQGDSVNTCLLLDSIILESNGQFFLIYNENKALSLLSLAENQCLKVEDILVKVYWEGDTAQVVSQEIRENLLQLGYQVSPLFKGGDKNSIQYHSSADAVFAKQIKGVCDQILALNILSASLKPLTTELNADLNRSREIDVFIQIRNIPTDTISNLTDTIASTGNESIRLDSIIKIISISGQVTDENNIPLTDVLISIGNYSERISNGNGLFSIQLDTSFLDENKLSFFKENYEVNILEIKAKRDTSNIKVILNKTAVLSKKGNKALLFALNEYDEFLNLRTPISDSESIARLLENKYAYQTEIVYNPTRNEIRRKLNEYSRFDYADNDQLLIYFSGHGVFDEVSNVGYFVPVDGRTNDLFRDSYLSFDYLGNTIDNYPCQHILLVFDACYSDSFDQMRLSVTGSTEDSQLNREYFIQSNLKNKSRLYIMSGEKERALDYSSLGNRFVNILSSGGGTDNIVSFNEITANLDLISPRPRYGAFGDHKVGGNFLFIGEKQVGSITSFSQYSCSYDLTDRFETMNTLGEVEGLLRNALNKTGYSELSYFTSRNSSEAFALMTRLEQIEENGDVKLGPSRWSTTSNHSGDFFGKIFQLIRGKKKAHFRYIIFTISKSEDLEDFFEDKTLSDPINLFRNGKISMTNSLKEVNKEGFNIKAYVIEYELYEGDNNLILNQLGLPCETHLLSSGLLEQFSVERIPLPEMLLVQGGTFNMGCTPEQEANCDDDEKPVRENISVGDFYLGKYEVTNEEFAAFLTDVGENREEGGVTWINLKRCGIELINLGIFRAKVDLERHPVNYVTWYGAKAYCQWLSQKTGMIYKLPMEVQWEYAARGGRNSKPTVYAGSDQITEVAWYSGNSETRTHSIEETINALQPNELGIYNMSGNVFEWTEDCWHESYQNAPTNQSVWLEGQNGDCSRRVIRGGALNGPDVYCRVSKRNSSSSDVSNMSLGFRVAQY